jgi:hypothetical protein
MSFGRPPTKARPAVSVFLLMIAAAVVYLSSPQRHLAAQGSSAGSDQWYVTDSGKLWRIDTGPIITEIGPLTADGPGNCVIAGGNEYLGMDTAPDGTVYAVAMCPADGYMYQWGRLDPETAVFTPIGGLSAADELTGPQIEPRLNFGVGFKIAFLPQFGAPGTPIGYRLQMHQSSAYPVMSHRWTLHAIDALAPYREHELDTNIAPLAWNFGIGVTADSSTIYPVTTDQIYKLALSQLGQNVTPAMHLSVLEISPDAVVSGFDSNGFLSLFDGVSWWRIKPTAPTSVADRVQLPGLNFIRAAFMRRAPLGGVRVEPHEQLVTSESGTTATFTAVLTAQPTANVTVNFTSSDTSEGTVSPSSATFTTGNWKTPQTITVTGVVDSDTTHQAFTIVTESTSPDPNYNGRGILDVDVTNADVNQAPALTAGTPSARQGSPAAGATLGTVSDLESAAGSLTVETITVPSGVTVGTITNTTGTIAAPLSASCSATTGARTLTLRVTDEASATTDQDVTVTVLPNTAPTMGTYNAAAVTLNAATTATPSAAPTDNGSVSLVDVSSPTFTGTLSVNASTGTVSVSDAAPAGAHTVTITATDNCGATFSRTFELTVNTVPTLTGGTPSARQGSPATGATLGTVSDTETGAGSLTVATVTVPSGLTVGTVTNDSGTISAPLTASCSATLGSNTLTLRVTDGHGATNDQDVTVTVLGNTAPTLGTYNAASVLPNGSASVTASASPGDNGSITQAEASAPGLLGSQVVNTSTGTVSITSARPVGLHTVTVTVTDNCGDTASRTFDLTVNTPPTLTPSPLPSRRVQQGSLTIGTTFGTVGDGEETSAGSLTIDAVTPPSGVTVGTIANTSGTLTAPWSASCSSPTGAQALTLRIGDGLGTADHDVPISVLANVAPDVGFYGATTVAPGGSVSVTATSGPVDNGTVALVEVSSPSFTGSLTVDSSSGAVSISNASPAGAHTITITATDNCGATSSRTLALTVNTAPTLTPGSPAARQGSPATGATLGTVSDGETAAGSLSVATVTVPSGLTVGTITNTGGTITAPLTATCSATPGARLLTLRVTDGLGVTTDQEVTVTVLANTAPTVGVYAASTVSFAGSATVTPSEAPADNGSLSTLTAAPAFTGGLSSNDSTGVIAVSNAGPAGGHTVTVTITDNCNAATTATFTLTVSCPTASSLGASGASFTLGGGSGSVGVTAEAGCAWSTSNAVPWINVVNGDGTGSGTATFTVAENRSGAARSTNLTIGGQSFGVAQSVGVADAVIIAGTTPVRAIHIVEMRIGIDLARARFGLAASAWTDATVAVGATPIRAMHINELRTALLQAYAAAKRPLPSFTDAVISSDTIVRAVHFNELRAAIVALE